MNNGGPAFPSIAPEFDGIDSDGIERWGNAPSGGMTLRDYFIAHAPPEPQFWFEPVMLTLRPPVKWMNEARTKEYDSEIEAEKECGDCYIDANDALIRAWDTEKRKQRYVQWPAAWADAMLRAREQK